MVMSMTIDEAIAHAMEVAEQNETQADKIGRQLIGSAMDKCATDCRECAADHRQLAEWLMELKDGRAALNDCGVEIEMLLGELREAKRLLKLAVEDFAKLDRVNTKVRNCMMPDMDCADCPLSWDSVDDSVEPCHNWRYTNEAEKLIGEDINVNTREDGERND